MAANLTNDNVGLSLPKNRELVTPVSSVTEGQSWQSCAGLNRIVSKYVTMAIAENSRRAYRQDLADFQRWGGNVPCSPEMLAAFIADRAATLSPHTITRRVVGISKAHTSKGLPDPAKSDLVRTVLRGIRRKNGKPQRQVTPVLKQDLLAMLPLMIGVKGLRDRALILLGFAAALRRSELVALDVVDLQFVREGLVLHLRRSKTDQEGQGRKIGVPFGRTAACPVKAVQEWLSHSKIETGAIFRPVNKAGAVGDRLTAQSVALIVKSYAKAVGLPSANYAGHSLRSGLVTSAAMAGVADRKIQQQTGHRSLEMLHRYVRDANAFVDNAAGAVL